MVKAAALHQVAQYKTSLKRTTQRTHDFLKFELSNRSFISRLSRMIRTWKFESPDPTDPTKLFWSERLMQNSDWYHSAPFEGPFS